MGKEAMSRLLGKISLALVATLVWAASPARLALRPWCRRGCAGLLLPTPDRRLRFALSGSGRSPRLPPARQPANSKAGKRPGRYVPSPAQVLLLAGQGGPGGHLLKDLHTIARSRRWPEKVGQALRRPCAACFATRQRARGALFARMCCCQLRESASYFCEEVRRGCCVQLCSRCKWQTEQAAES